MVFLGEEKENKELKEENIGEGKAYLCGLTNNEGSCRNLGIQSPMSFTRVWCPTSDISHCSTVVSTVVQHCSRCRIQCVFEFCMKQPLHSLPLQPADI